jgi:tetratricopeptide (TPR) repeat protein
MRITPTFFTLFVAFLAALGSPPGAAAQSWGEGGLLGCRNLQEEARRYEQRLAESPDDLGVLNDFAWLSLVCGDYARAEALYERSLSAHPGNRDALMGMGLLNLELWRAGRAEDFFLRVLERNPGDPDAIRMLAELGNRFRLRVEGSAGRESGPEERARNHLFLGADWRLAWNVQLSAAYFQTRDAVFGISPVGGQEGLAGSDQQHNALARVGYRAGKFVQLGAIAHLAEDRDPWLHGAGMDAAIMLTRRIEFIGRVDGFRVPDGHLGVFSPALILRFPEQRDAWTRLQYFRQEGFGTAQGGNTGLVEVGVHPRPGLVTTAGIVRATRSAAPDFTSVYGTANLALTQRLVGIARYRILSEAERRGHLFTLGIIVRGL